MKTHSTDKQKNVRLNPEDLALLAAIAERRGVSDAQVLRDGIRLQATEAERVNGRPGVTL
jgi:hypothetical protein